MIDLLIAGGRGYSVGWPTQNFGWVCHSAFGPTNNWPVRSLISRKCSKIGTTIRQIFRLKCNKFAICWGCAPEPAGGALAVFKWPTSKGKEGRGKTGAGKIKGR